MTSHSSFNNEEAARIDAGGLNSPPYDHGNPQQFSAVPFMEYHSGKFDDQEIFSCTARNGQVIYDRFLYFCRCIENM